mmetsp:Transcript_13608/g.15256  ORF Transcript_13608/g.15256 Transcript_13608/m.15256 type:complete len:391 (+) Transcript_13608:311-1483(+)|eukprot:CAMPEP_0205822418 /NCGR_PEP_ID=MMETSP0206-20130828/12399_1 /ASSEMBLY_ACC=CAM_ASM_000279 /TAXON_ID=36767 /ORGANISM="Euplotes focardii, Strain TN1" /LENGTH=390 /DNA_ID=CAMNT_0053118671 /DNA_START=281 /DNA_END=1453 /DNA_ORIENTATION=+
MTECLKEYIDKIIALFPQKPQEGGDPDDAPEAISAGKLSDFQADSEILQWAGVGFGQDETFRLQASLTKLSVTSASEKLRFWGKIYGTERDYYVAEGFIAASGDEEEGEKPKGFEERGSGVNEFVYWVANDSLSDWTVLPDATPVLLKATRGIKVKFTGDLEKKIITNPFFFGEEKYYLRAQISRITHSTTIMPGGLHKLTEDSPKEIEAIEFEEESKAYKPSTESQSVLPSWVHAKKSILNSNRVSHLEPEGDEFGDKEPEEIQKILDQRDPSEARLKPLSEDASQSGEDSAWTIRLLGDQTRTPGLNGKTKHHGVVVVKSTVWIGSITCWKEDSYIQIYIGDGLKNENKTYYPILPPTIPEDPVDLEEVSEPNPSEAPAEPEEVKEEQ